MPVSTNKSRRRSLLWIIIGIVLAGLVTWQVYKYKIAGKAIHKAVTEKSRGLYTITYDSLVIDEVGGSLHVKNIEIKPDTIVYHQMEEAGTNPPILLTLTIPQLDISGVKTPKALLNNKIEGGQIEIRDPTITIELNDLSKDSTVYNPGKDISKELLGKLLLIKMDNARVSHANLIVKKRASDKFLFKGSNVSFLLSDLLIDSVSNKDSSRILFSRNLEMTGDELVIPSKNKKYRWQIEKIRFASRDNSFHIGRIRLEPQMPEEEFAHSFKTQKDRYDFMLEGVSLLHIDRESLWHKRLEADSLVVRNSSFKIYHDLSLPRDTASKIGSYPHQQLMKVPFPLSIKKMIFERSFIEYKEKNPKSDSAGKLQFYQVRATISNVTNRKEVIARNNRCVLLFNARFLNKAPVRAELVMLLKDPKGRFTIKGELAAIAAPSVNPLTQPMALARMENGTIDKLRFTVDGSDSASTGKVEMLYRDLKISLLKKDEEENKYDKKGLASLAANIAIKNSNPGKKEQVRTASVKMGRDLNRSFFNLIWKSIFKGVKETVGIKK